MSPSVPGALKIAGGSLIAVGTVAAGAAIGLAVQRRVVARNMHSDADWLLPTFTPKVHEFTTSDGTALHVEIDELTGDKNPLTVILCHGYALSSASLVFQRAVLEDRVRVISYDQRSHGQSGSSQVAFDTVDQLGQDLSELIDAFAPSGPLMLVGHSMGGMLALEWAARYPTRMFACAPICTAARHSAQNIAFHEIGRQAIMTDVGWSEGRYIERGTFPAKGLAIARMTAHVTYLSEAGLQEKFGRRLQNKKQIGFGFGVDFQVESYLQHQGQAFIERFDPNSYLYITRAMDYFDLEVDFGKSLPRIFRETPVRFCVVSFSSDWLFPTSESRTIVRALNAAAANVSFTEVETDTGHDAFLLDEPDFHRTLQGFIDGAARARGLA